MGTNLGPKYIYVYILHSYMEPQEELFVQGLGVMQNHAQKNHMK